MKFSDFISIDDSSRVPKYQQIVDSVIHNISAGHFKIGQKILSINKFSEEFFLSRDTVERAYSILKERKLIVSIRGKGYYINKNQLISKINVLFLVNKLSTYKLRIYNAFVEKIGPNAHVELLIYHCDEALFLSLIEKHRSNYDYLVFMPHFKGKKGEHLSMTDAVFDVLKTMPEDRIFFLDNALGSQSFQSGKVYQDFEIDFYEALKSGIEKIRSYKKMVLFYPQKAVYPYPYEILTGFKKFCGEHKIAFEVLEGFFENMIIKKGDLFVSIEESDLVDLMKRLREQKFVIGKDVGIISFNDTPLKELLGTTVVSTDFKLMGTKMAEMVLENSRETYKVPFSFLDRNSV